MSVGIDDSANTVWLLRASDTGMSGWEAHDPENIVRWGPITYYEKIDNAYCRNDEQMQLRAAIELCTRDVEKRTIDINALGLTGLRAGMLIRINLPWLSSYFGEVSKSKLVYLDSVSHTWEEGTHTMTLKAEALAGDIDLEIWKRLSTSVGLPKRKKTVKSQTDQLQNSDQEELGFFDLLGGLF